MASALAPNTDGASGVARLAGGYWWILTSQFSSHFFPSGGTFQSLPFLPHAWIGTTAEALTHGRSASGMVVARRQWLGHPSRGVDWQSRRLGLSSAPARGGLKRSSSTDAGVGCAATQRLHSLASCDVSPRHVLIRSLHRHRWDGFLRRTPTPTRTWRLSAIWYGEESAAGARVNGQGGSPRGMRVRAWVGAHGYRWGG
jgi:hypothetical protein